MGEGLKGALQAEIHGGRYYRVPRLLTKPGQAQDRELPEVVEERCINRSTVVTSQLPIENWHAALGDPTAADAILDRLVHTAHRLRLSGESMRRQPEPAPGNQ